MKFKQAIRQYNPYRRAIAMAIDLERTHDQLANLLGHSVPIGDRITSEPNRESRRQRLNLPRPLTLEALNDMAARRMAAIEELHSHIAPTLGHGGAGLIDDLVEEMRERTSSEEHHRGTRKGPSRQIAQEDRMSFEDILRRDIVRAADAPPPPLAMRTRQPANDDTVDRVSFSVDLVTEGLLDHYGVNRAALYAELLGLRAKLSNRNNVVALVSPALRSNTAKQLVSLGKTFPPAMLRLRGLSLDVERITMPIRPNVDDHAVWTYRGSGGGRDSEMPQLTRDDGMNGYDLFDMPRRALRDVLQDVRFHDAIVIERTDRYGASTNQPSTVIRLRRGFAHLDPPGNEAHRQQVRRPVDVRMTRQRFDEPHLIYAALVNRLLHDRGVIQRHRLLPGQNGGVTLAIGGQRDTLVHRYEIKADTLADGEQAIGARIDNILNTLRDWTNKNIRHIPSGAMARSPAAPAKTVANTTSPAPVPDKLQTDSVPPSLDAHSATPKEAATVTPTTPEKTVATCWGAEAAEAYARSERVDDLLRDVLALGGPSDPEDVELLHLEKLTCVKRMPLADDMLYRVEKFDRVMGRPTYAIATVEVERKLSPGAIEALRDGSIGLLVKTWPNFARSQVRRVSQHEGMLVVTIRTPLSDRA